MGPKPGKTPEPEKVSRRSRFLSDYGMLLVLGLLIAVISLLTITEQFPTGASAGDNFAEDLVELFGTDVNVFVAGNEGEDNIAFVDALNKTLRTAGVNVVGGVKGEPKDARKQLVELHKKRVTIDIIAGNEVAASWLIFDDLATDFPRFANVKVVKPKSYLWPTLLKAKTLLTIVNQSTVIAILGIGMTLVIITAGIDLSVGSLIGLSAVVCTILIRDVGGAKEATALVMIMCCAAAIALCALIGAFAGTIVLKFHVRPYVIPAFIVTLSIMLVARGLAFIVGENQTINDIPDTFNWLSGGRDLFGIPNAVILMLILYTGAHILMSRMTLGRYIYAVGGNREAARLSGVPVERVLLFVYALCGALAGLGGIVLASRLRAGSATFGDTYELYVIAAVVVGGTSLMGGEGKVFGTLIGALIIAVVQSGLNQAGVMGRKQDLALGLIILAAVMLNMLNKRGWHIRRKQFRTTGS